MNNSCWLCGRIHKGKHGLLRCNWLQQQKYYPGTLPSFASPKKYRAYVLRVIRRHRKRLGLSLIGWDTLTAQG
jgi:hypothetical protein